MNKIIIHEDFVEILLTRNGFYAARALIDLDDLETVKQYHWYLDQKGYVAAKGIDGSKYPREIHRLIMNNPKGMIVDHINRDKLDNRKSNLRICTTKENNRNKSLNSNNKTGYKGVSPCLYKVSISKDGITYNLGKFNSKEQAARAYDRKAIELYGEFACTNFPIKEYSHLLELGEIRTHESIYDSFDLDSWNLFDVSDDVEIDYDNII